MGEIVKIKHLLWTIGALLFYSFIFGMNVNAKLTQIQTNKTDIKFIKAEEKKNHKEVMLGLHRIELQLKDKKNRDTP